MRKVCFVFMVVFVFSVFMAYAAFSFAAPQAPTGKVEAFPKVEQNAGQFNCMKDPEAGAICKRPAGAMGKVEKEIIVTEKAGKGKPCKWKCTMEQGVEICRGNGPQCDGKIPPHSQSRP